MLRLVRILGILLLAGLLLLLALPADDPPAKRPDRPAPDERPVKPLLKPLLPRNPFCPGPNCPLCPGPNCPGCAACTPVTLAQAPGDFVGDGSRIGGTVSPDGKEEVQCDLPQFRWQKNGVGIPDGRGERSGLCVFYSIAMAADWQNERRLVNFGRDMQAEVGGGHPAKVDAMVAKYGPGSRYIQHQGGDMALLRKCLATGRMAMISYGYSPRYICERNPTGSIYHAVDVVHLSDRWACVLDNNFVEPDSLEWMSPNELARRWTMNKGGWLFALLNPPPPPPPFNTKTD